MAMEAEAAGVSDVRELVESFSWLAEMTFTWLGKPLLSRAALSLWIGRSFSLYVGAEALEAPWRPALVMAPGSVCKGTELLPS